MSKILFSIPLLFLFLINSYAQTKISSLGISGNKYLSLSEIANMMLSQKDGIYKEDQFQIDLKTVRDKYKTSGYLYARFEEELMNFTEDSSFVDIKLKINEGDKVIIGKIDIHGITSLKKNDVLNNFETKVGENLNDNILNDDINGLLKTYEKSGLPFAKINIRDIAVYKENGKDKIKIEIAVTENSRVQIDQVKIKGNETTKDYVILRELKLDKNKIVNSESTLRMKERLDRLNIFSSVSDPRIYTSKNKNESGLLIEVTEGNTNTFDGILGYIPPFGDEKGYFTGLVNVSFRNLFGTGRKVEAKYLQEVEETQELMFGYFEPYFFNLPFNINFGFLQRIQDSTYTLRNLDLQADFVFSDKFIISAIGGYDRVIPSDITDPAFTIADSRVLLSGIELRYDSRDNIFIPSKGFLYKASYSYGNKKIFNYAQLQGLGYPEDFSVQRYSLDLDFYLSFIKRQTVLLKLFGGEVRSEKLEDSDYYRIGGNKYIRGYRTEQFLASRLAVSNFELRYSISRKGFLFGFFDSGYYFRPPDVTNNFPEQSGFLYGYGIGIRLETGLGLIGVSYALGQENSILDGNISFGLINDF
ncbi:MAG: BamA/TamA family outer membrane protein [Bacteroidota bacterium]|nr:BamA/TamA family outer membrane protein [Bacteroidota bacterium]